MWIFCCGGQRSGSTLQFNLVCELVERLQIGQRIEYVKPEDFPNIKAEYSNYNGYKIFKSHILTETIKAELLKGNALGVYSYRDIRDVVVSLMKKNNVSFNINKTKEITERYLAHYYQWMEVKEYLYIAQYENFYNNLEVEIDTVAHFLNLEVPYKLKKELAEFLNIDNQKELIASSSDENLTKVDNNQFNKKYLLHTNHIYSGGVNQWKTQLSAHQLVQVEIVAYNWLLLHGYEVSWPSMKDEFLSSSQHADDYLAWQILGKKKEGLVVEVGAFDGIHLSNSYSLEQLGWKSICIEPNPNIYKFLKKNRPKAVNINAAVLDDSTIEQIEFFIEEIGVLSGCTYDEEDVKQRYKNRGLEYKKPEKITVPSSTLNHIFENNNLQKYEIDILSIDVEGLEVSVLNSFDINYYEPGLIIIEANTEQDKKNILDHFRQYKQYFFLGNNRQNLFLLREDLWDKKMLKKMDFFNYKAVVQYHPINQKLAIQSISPEFEGSEKYKILTRLNFLEKIIRRIK